MTGSRFRILPALIVVVLLGACGDDDAATTTAVVPTLGNTTAGSPGAPRGGDIDACALVTQADAERILGEPVEFMETDEPEVVVVACVWSNVAADHGALLQFRVFAGAPFFSEEAYVDFTGYLPADGPGDDAYWVVDDNSATLTVLTGDLVFVLDASKGGGGFDAAAVQAELLDLADRVLAAL